MILVAWDWQVFQLYPLFSRPFFYLLASVAPQAVWGWSAFLRRSEDHRPVHQRCAAAIAFAAAGWMRFRLDAVGRIGDGRGMARLRLAGVGARTIGPVRRVDPPAVPV